ncbi:IclR family transcriptional regulator [Sulfitobacter geojensis]|jgi:DNA-binding IclR family transcriptional regulator|uniref:IclR family transcriptional regulator n=1 Tax=Sulfitobacter geojensis TaxID=1342299 RepID=A0AAE2VZX9_9RHOB|nr:IclR family transcriptional regulator [Sulfitobacter geojensis]KHA53882.1 Transcriptional regulator, IclR family [Sulfitobacter geojensis]MBM1690610.1 IclR family transcriptional regulator [Sulfitobacter geojensis]MBM1694676.1 IclR family transcriptional regulator [Sulfitobacter geojensis]MBM1706842.1 IclR family transcriptional regulator [Sulfitobacter geojensis]MBM1710900.1 IclR family transcriptional regulator [Sulfitobacter geojensis]
MPDARDSDKAIPTNLRLLLLLEEVARVGVPVTPTATNEVLGLPKPTVHRLFHRLEEEGFLQRDVDGRSYSAGQRLRKLSANVLSSSRIRVARLAVLHALTDDVGETCNIATADRDGMLYIDRVETKWPLRIQLPIGTTVPFHCTASGKMYLSSLSPRHLAKFLSSAALEAHTDKTLTTSDALMAEVATIRERGYSTDNEEFMNGMVAVAVPIRDDLGRLMSTISLHAPDQRVSVSDLENHLDRLRSAAQDLSEMMQS